MNDRDEAMVASLNVKMTLTMETEIAMVARQHKITRAELMRRGAQMYLDKHTEEAYERSNRGGTPHVRVGS